MSDINLREILESIVQESEGDQQIAVSLAIVWFKRLGLPSAAAMTELLDQSKQLERTLSLLLSVNNNLQHAIGTAKDKARDAEYMARYGLSYDAEIAYSPSFETWISKRFNASETDYYREKRMAFSHIEDGAALVKILDTGQELWIPLKITAEMRAAWLAQQEIGS